MNPLNRNITFPLILVFLLVAPAHSATVSVSGETVDFYFDSMLAESYTPVVTGNSLSFAPNDISTQALNTDGSALGLKVFDIRVVVTKDGEHLVAADLNESGQYLLNTPAGGSFVNATGELSVRDANDPAAEVAGAIDAIDPFTPTGLTSASWEAAVNLDLTQLGSTDAFIRITNILLAGAFNLGDIAFINKDFLRLTVQTAVPIPAAIWLFGSALLGMVATGRRKTVA